MDALEFFDTEIAGKGFRATDVFSGFAKSGGFALGGNLRLSPDYNLKSELLSGRAMALTKNGLSSSTRHMDV